MVVEEVETVVVDVLVIVILGLQRGQLLVESSVARFTGCVTVAVGAANTCKVGRRKTTTRRADASFIMVRSGMSVWLSKVSLSSDKTARLCVEQ